MAQPPGLAPTRRKAENDIYTIMMMVACAFLVGAVSFLAYRMIQNYGSIIPPPGG